MYTPSNASSSPANKTTPPQVEEFVVNGGKWGPSGTLGSDGGIVTWSLTGAGLSNQTGSGFFTGLTVTLGNFLNFDFQAVLNSAFDAWSSVANIEFIQIADAGGNIGVGTSADIRVSGGFIDGPSSVLARAFLPLAGGSSAQSATSGDMVFDSGDMAFFTASSFFLVAAHEIGHALGLSHEFTNLALMNPSFNSALSGLQQDDINGIQAVYGIQDFGPNIYNLPTGQSDLTVISGAPDLAIFGNALNNAIIGSDDGETISGGVGGDHLYGKGGDDTLFGDNGSSGPGGISLGSGQLTKAVNAGNNSTATATDLSNLFSFAADPDIANATTIPHVSVAGAGDGTVDVYAVDINNVGSTFTLDIDGATFDSFIQIMDGSGRVFATNDDSPTSNGADGSTSTLDSFLTFSVTVPGTYFIAVGSFPALTTIPSDNSYDLQVSVSGEFMSGGGNDALFGGFGNDTLFGGIGDDELRGGPGNDSLNGDAGNDLLRGGPGNDLIKGNAGNDTIFGRIGEDDLRGGGGADTINGEDGNDMLRGGPGNDTLNGDAGNDLLRGGPGNDTLTGGIGNDTILGRIGDDTLDGGIGEDLFQFDPGDGNDTISGGFEGGAGIGDVIQLMSIAGFSNFADITNPLNSDDSTGSTVITLSASQSITIEGTLIGALDADDFLFS